MSPFPDLLVSRQFDGSPWELPAWPNVQQRLLIGWGSSAPHALVAALCSVAALTFPSLIRAPLGHQLLPRTWRVGQHYRWITTCDVSSATAGIFATPGFDWHQRGQVVFLSEPGTIPALQDRDLLQAATIEDPTRELADRGVTGILLPGVDGSVAGFYGLVPLLDARVLEALQQSNAKLKLCPDSSSFADNLRRIS